MPRDIDTVLLRAFVAVVDTGSVTGAARLLNRTQAAVSQQLKRLEEQFGVDLFLREHKKLVLAPAGERLLGAAQRIVALNDETWGAMTTPDFKGEVVFGVPTDIVPTYVPPILRRFATSWPHVRVTLRTGNSLRLLEQFDDGVVNVTMTTDLESDGRPELLRLDKLVWVGAPGGKAWQQSPLPIAAGDESCRFRPIALDTLRAAGRTWRLALEISNQVAQDAAVSADIAVAPCLRDSVPDSLTVLGSDSGLPELPEFMINLYAPPVGVNELADELARHVRAEFVRRFGPPPERVGARGKSRRRRELVELGSLMLIVFERLAARRIARRARPDAAALAAIAGKTPAAVITGGSEGIGLALAQDLARQGTALLLIARRPEPLQAAAEQIRKLGSQPVATLALDVTRPDTAEAIADTLAASGLYADLLINNAGVGLAGDYADADAAHIASLVDLNVRALSLLTRRFLPEMLARGRGGVLNVASLGGLGPGPGQAAYYASKAYVVSLTLALAHENRGRGVRIAVLAPGPVETRFHTKMGAESSWYRHLMPAPAPERIARSALFWFGLGRRLIVPGLIEPVLSVLMRLPPYRMPMAVTAFLLTKR